MSVFTEMWSEAAHPWLIVALLVVWFALICLPHFIGGGHRG